MAKIELIIDTDPGVDDALAIMLAAAHPDVNLHALTVVAGNVGLGHTVPNACKILDVIGSQAKVYPGAATPLVFAPEEDAAFVHGADGLGDVGFERSSRPVENESAAAALVRMVNKRPGEMTIAAIGPLTNLALALHLDPELPAKTGRLLVMGGAVTGHGNVSKVSSEFNIYSDPEAAHLVFERWPMLELVDWEATVRHGFGLDQLDRWRQLGTAKAEFYDAISRQVVAFVRGGTDGEPMMRAADALALAVVVEPEIVRQADQRFVTIETHGRHTRGQTTVDWLNRLGRPANARIVHEVNQQRFVELMTAALS